MRADMSKVIVERPRPGSRMRTGGDFRQRVKAAAKLAMTGRDIEALDDLGKFLGITRLHRHTRSFNEYLQPLRRYVLAQVGRKWDDVYSEICQHLNRGSTVHDHIFQHLYQYVERHTYLEDGEVFVNTEYGWSYRRGSSDAKGRLPIDEHYCDTYVHPGSGVLCKPSTLARKARYKLERDKRLAEERAKKRVIDTSLYFERENGVWFKHELIPCKTAWSTMKRSIQLMLAGQSTRTTLTSDSFSYGDFVAYCKRNFKAEVYPSGRKTASKKDIKQHGLERP